MQTKLKVIWLGWELVSLGLCATFRRSAGWDA